LTGFVRLCPAGLLGREEVQALFSLIGPKRENGIGLSTAKFPQVRESSQFTS